MVDPLPHVSFKRKVAPINFLLKHRDRGASMLEVVVVVIGSGVIGVALAWWMSI
jgi:hypothetical protein